MKSDMTCDLNHLEYANYLAERELLNKSSVRNITSLTESADGEQIALQEAADIRVYLQKIVANIQNVWNKFKNSVAKLEANSALKDYKTILSGNPVGEDITIDEGVEIPNLAELNKLVNLQPVAFYASNEYGDVNDFFKKNYNDFFNNLGDTITPMDAANEKCFTVAKGEETIGFNKSSDSKFPTIAACYGYLNNYQNNVANVIQKDINNINNATKIISGAMDVAKKQSETRKQIYKNEKDVAKKIVSNPKNYQPNAAAQTGAPTGGNNGANNGNNGAAKSESSNISFGYNSSYGVLMELFGHGKKSKPTSAPKKSAVKNNTTNNTTNSNNQQNANNTQNDTQDKSLEQKKQDFADFDYESDQKSTDPVTFVRNNSINFMKGLTKVLSIKFAESNKARASCLKFCVQYAKQVAEENKDNDNSNNNNNNDNNNGTENGNNNQQQQQDNNANIEVPQIK